VEAVRENEKGVLKIDGIPEFQGSAPERATQLQVSLISYIITATLMCACQNSS